MSLADELQEGFDLAVRALREWAGGFTGSFAAADFCRAAADDLERNRASILAALTERKAPGEVEGLVERPSDQDVETMLSRKWLDPECLHDGCQSLVWKRKFERCDAERDKFLWQVRDTCSRAEKAEAELATLKQQLAEREEALREAVAALKPFASHVGKSGSVVKLSIGDDTWTHSLTTEHFHRASNVVRRALTRNTDGAATCNQGSAPENGDG
jgi:hypothetical protein